VYIVQFSVNRGFLNQNLNLWKFSENLGLML